MFLMVETGIRGWICHTIYRFVKASNQHIKIMIKLKNHHILSIGTKIIRMDGQCHKSYL